MYIKLTRIALNRLILIGAWGLGLGSWGMAPGASAAADEVHVAAAVSLSEALQEIATAFERQHGVRVTLNLAASNVLARQIAAGATTDVFISADAIQMEVCPAVRDGPAKGRFARQSPCGAGCRRLDVQLASASDLRRPEIARIAIGDPAGVPAGAYAMRYLQAEKVWDALKPKIVTTGSVRAALAALEAGNVDAAIVYRTDARIARRTRAAYPSPSEPVVMYPAALLTAVPEAARFYAFLRSAAADAIFERHGFSLPASREERAPRAKGGS